MSPHITQHTSDIWTIHNFLSPQECAALIQKGEDLGFKAATVRMRSGQTMLINGVRNNDRAERTDADFAAELWERVRGFVPEEMEGCAAQGLWENFRFYRYDVGQRFKKHRDGSVVLSETNQKSRLSFLLYLNADYQGGETIFDEASAALGADNAENPPVPPLVITPQIGQGLIFVHERRHEGAQVTQGRKYLLRTDVLYSAPPV